MEITKDVINDKAFDLLEEIYEYEGSENTEKTLGRVMGIVGMAQEMKKVLEGVSDE